MTPDDIPQLRAYIAQYANGVDERAQTGYPVEAFLAWLSAELAGAGDPAADQAAAQVLQPDTP